MGIAGYTSGGYPIYYGGRGHRGLYDHDGWAFPDGWDGDTPPPRRQKKQTQQQPKPKGNEMNTNMVLNLLYLQQGAQLVEVVYLDLNASSKRYTYLDLQGIAKVDDYVVVSVRDTYATAKVVRILNQEDYDAKIDIRLKHVLALVDVDHHKRLLDNETKVLQAMRMQKLQEELAKSGLPVDQLGKMLISHD